MTPQFKGVKAFFISMIERYLAKRCDQLVTVGVNVKEDLDNHRIRSKSETISIQPAVLPLKLKSKKLKVLGWQHASDVLPIADLVLSTYKNEEKWIALIGSNLLALPLLQQILAQ
jgi:hypothetical protein